MKKYDFVIIGSGPAGFSAAIVASKARKSVLIIEKDDDVGGACVNTGTFPSKTLREAVLHLTGYLKRDLFDHDISCAVDISMKKLTERLHYVRCQEHRIIEKQLERNKVSLVRGTAKILNSSTVEISSQNGTTSVVGDKIIIATGSRPRRPDDVKFEKNLIMDSTDILNITEIPKSMIILGGGVIGTEYATIFATIGVKVVLIDKGDTPLKFLDSDINKYLVDHFPNNNITYIPNCGEIQIEKSGDMASVKIEDGRGFSAETLFFALGREANSGDLGLENINTELNKYKYITVNDKYQTDTSNIYAIGDIIGWPSLAATSMLQGRVAASHALNPDDVLTVPTIFPVGIYTIPEISSVGLTEEEVKESGVGYVVGLCSYDELPRPQISGEVNGLLKIIVEKDSRKILGVHIIGSGATEIIHIGLMAMLANATIDIFIDNIFNYPTYSESYKIASFSALNQLN